MSGPEANFTDPERVHLITRISQALWPVPKTFSWTTFHTSWACLWLSDVEKLKELNEYIPSRVQDLRNALESTEGRKIVQKWTQRDRDPRSKTPSATSTPSATPDSKAYNNPSTPRPFQGGVSSPTPLARAPEISPLTPVCPAPKRPGETIESPKKKKARSSTAPVQCRERDGSCVLTNTSLLVSEVAHLYPFAMADQSTMGVYLFWNTLEMFWTKEHVQQWWKAIFGDDDGTEKVENMLCLSPSAHAMHGKCLFGLEPLEKDPAGMWLTVTFWWLMPNDPVGETTDFSRAPQLPQNMDPRHYSLGLHNVQTDKPIQSGDVITFTTSDPVTHPLPDTRLLEMQWVMNRIGAISGAGEEDDDPNESDMDPDDGADIQRKGLVPSSSIMGQSSPPSSLPQGEDDDDKLANTTSTATNTLEEQYTQE